jgi:hypothetical protein
LFTPRSSWNTAKVGVKHQSNLSSPSGIDDRTRFRPSCFDPLVCLLSKTFQSVGLQIFWPWVHMKTVIPETRLVHYIWYLRLIFRFDIYVWYLRLISTFYTRKTKRWIDWIPLYHAEEIYVDCLKMQYSYTTPSSCEGNVF